MRDGDGEGDAEGEGDGDGDGDGEGDGDGFADFEGDAAAVEGGRDAGSRVVNAADGDDDGCFFLAFFSLGDPDAEDEGGCSVTRCTAAAGVPGGPGLCRLVTARAVPPAARASTIAAPAIARRCRRCDSCLRCLRCLTCQRCRRCRDSPAATAS